MKITQRVKLTDPQLEIDRNSNGLTKAVIHNVETFLAPEILENVPKRKVEHHADKYKTDVFSLGATLLGLATLTHSEELFDYKTGALNEHLLRERLESVQAMYSTFTYELILEMLAYDHYNRPNFIDIEDKLLPYHEVIRHKRPLPFKKEAGLPHPHSVEEMPVVHEHEYEHEYEHEHIEGNGATSKVSAIQAKSLDSIAIMSEECDVEEERGFSSHKMPNHKSDEVFMTSSADLQDEDYPDEQYQEEAEIIKSKSSVDQWRSKNEFEPDDDLDIQIKKALQRTQETYKQVQVVDSLPVFIEHHDETPHREVHHHHDESYTLAEAYNAHDGEKIRQKNEEQEQSVAQPHLHHVNHANEVERRNFISFGVPDPSADVYTLKKSEVLEVNKNLDLKTSHHNDELKRSKVIEDILKEFLPTPKKVEEDHHHKISYALEEGSVSLKASSNLQHLYKSPYYTTSNLGIQSAAAHQSRPLYSEVVTASSNSNRYGLSHEVQRLDYLTPSQYSSYHPSHVNSAIKLNLESII